MEISIVRLAAILRGLELLSSHLVLWFSFVSFTSAILLCLRSIRNILVKYFWLTCFHVTIGPHVWIQFHSYLPHFTSFLICLPIHFHFIFFLIFFSIWLLSLRSNFTLSQVGPTILFIYSLASIHFHFCFERINPCFTTLYSQMLSLAIGSIFTHFIPISHNSLSFFALLASWSTVYTGSIFLQFFHKMQSSIHQICTRCIQKSLPPQTGLPPHFTIEPLPFVASQIF